MEFKKIGNPSVSIFDATIFVTKRNWKWKRKTRRGTMMMTILLNNPKGYVCRIRHRDLMQVPDIEGNFSDALQILAGETIKIVQSKPTRSDVQISENFVQAGIKKRS
ncbi:9808_t:CDS:2 [Entrophospora sp. SA101]|nr:9808_t:CDS:2 [Entrophospora sp. SA101]